MKWSLGDPLSFKDAVNAPAQSWQTCRELCVLCVKSLAAAGILGSRLRIGGDLWHGGD